MKAGEFLAHLMSRPEYRGQITHIQEIPSRPARYAELDPPLAGPLEKALSELGIGRLYTHQALSTSYAREGKNVVVATGTASGKSLCYNMPVLERLHRDRLATALYVFPTKALAQDQLRGLLRLKEHLSPAGQLLVGGTYDGDTPRNTRKELREKANCILTNPDMLHGAILPYHPSWSRFFQNLAFVVLDEMHAYRGVFGSHVANCIRRLARVCRHYGSKPQFICCSATVANPEEFARSLLGQEVDLVDDDGSPRGPKRFALWNPPRLEDGVGRRSANTEATNLMAELVRRRIQTVTFTRTRAVAELISRYTREELSRYGGGLSERVKAYRGGYLPAERREIEKALFAGDLIGVASTNALELGIDVGGLDASIMVGYPGTVASTWQQAGRAGRSSDESLAVLVAHDSPIDQYLMHHPSYFFGRSPENAIIDPDNPHVVLGHLRSACFELPLQVIEEKDFGASAPALLELLEEQGETIYRANRWYWTGKGFPPDDVNLRTVSENTYTIMDLAQGNHCIGTMDEPSAFMQLFPQAVYLHYGETYIVESLNIADKTAFVRRAEVDYFTQAVTDRRVKIEAEDSETSWRKSKVCSGDLSVTVISYMFKKIKFYSKDSIGFGKIDLPPCTIDTGGFWLVPPVPCLHAVRRLGRNPVEGLLGIANVACEIIPLYVMCDPMDIGSAIDSSNIGVPTLFIYDRYPGGIGFAAKAYENVESVFTACLELIRSCGCDDGCPSCVGAPLPPFTQNDPDTQTRGRIPDKEAALVLLHELLEMEPYVPKPRHSPASEEGVGAGQGTGNPEAASALDLDYAHDSAPIERPPAEPLSERVELRIRKQLQRLRG